jgi:hypothetical protein
VNYIEWHMNWLIQIETELQRIRPDENPGRTRTTARRIAGIALRQFHHQSSEDFIKLIHSATGDSTLPDAVHFALERLATRLDINFNSPSVDPISDAMIVVEFVKKQLTMNN